VLGKQDAFGDLTRRSAVLTCDLCGKTENADDLTPDWNGDTGNHESCEQAEWNKDQRVQAMMIARIDVIAARHCLGEDPECRD
jgi:hypothetical protein